MLNFLKKIPLLKEIYRFVWRILCIMSSKVIISNYLKNNKIKKLHLGSGNHKINGWLNADIEATSLVAYIDVTKKFSINNEMIDYIFSEHMIEHINHHDGLKMLNESFRILKSSGKIRISTPDLQFLVDLYLDKNNQLKNDYIKWTCKNYQLNEANVSEVINNFFSSWGHKFIYDKKTIESTLKKAGFTKIEFFKINESNNAELRNLENDTRLPENFLQLESLTVEATKP